jgi:D-lactate dehydrogenase (cytochrome)
MSQELAFLGDIGLEDDQIQYGETVLTEHATDYGTGEAGAHRPDVVVIPDSTEDVSQVLAAADQHGTPVTPYAAGTGTEGNAVPVEGGISLDLTDLDGIYDVRPEDFQVDVGAGTVGSVVEDAAAEHDLFFPPFPQSRDISTVGGMIANDASGTRTVKYGEVADWVLELEVVLAGGEVVTFGSTASKTASGYNMKDLIVGSEGTLGVVTRATLELEPLPEERYGGRVIFETVDNAAAAVASTIRAGIDVAVLELVDPVTAKISNSYTGADLPDAPMVFAKFHGDDGDAVAGAVDRFRGICERHGALNVALTGADGEIDHLWRARREIGEAFVAYDPDLELGAIGDVTVPISAYPEMIHHVRSVAEEFDLLVPTFGHAGDGNVHYALLVDPDDPDHVSRGEEASDRIVTRALEMGGTSTGEHGVGRGKRKYMLAEHGETELAAMRAVKQALDPNGILNPGKIFPE